MTDLTLDTPHVADGITVPNFFNGRILSAEDLRLLLDGDRTHRRLLGRVIGGGVADGLRVTPSSATTVTVGGGVAVNGHGETIHLPSEVELDLAVTGGGAPVPVSTGVFLDCEPTSTDSTSAERAYVLTIRPDSTVSGSAPADIGASGGPCGPGFVREGVRFRRVAFDPVALWNTFGPEIGAPTTNQRRNALAQVFLGSWAWRFFTGHPFGRQPLHDAVADDLGIEPCEVPLAMFAIGGGGIRDLDVWAVRRRIHRRGTVALEQLIDDTRRAIGEAALHQFQDHLDELIAGSGTVVAAQRFVGLPAAGVLPADVLGNVVNAASFAAQVEVPFFASLPHRALDDEVSADRVEEILRRGTEMPAMFPTAGFGAPIHVALVESGLEAERYAVFFSDPHPAADLVRLDELADRIDDLETRIDIVPDTGPVVAVLYKPPKRAGATGGGVWSQWILGSIPELAVGTAGLLRFEVLTSDSGEYQFDVDVDLPGPRIVGRSLLTAQIVGAEFEPIPDPHTQALTAGKIVMFVRVAASKSPFAIKAGGRSGGQAKPLIFGDSDVLAEVPVTLTVGSTDDPAVRDSASAIVRITS